MVFSHSHSGRYNIHIFVNSEPIAASPIEIDVTAGSIDDVDELCALTHYKVGIATRTLGYQHRQGLDRR